MPQSKPFISKFPGYFTASNTLNLPEGAAVTAENVVFTREDLVEPRHGLPTWLAKEVDGSSVETNYYFGVPPAIDLAPGDINTGTDTFTKTAHGLTNGTLVRFETDGTLPTGLSTGTYYYIISVAANTFQVSTTSGGSAVDITAAGSDNFRLVYAEDYKNLYYWKTLTTSTYIASNKLDNGSYRFVEIEPQDYATNASPTYRFIMDGGNKLTVTDPGLTDSPFSLPRYIQTDDGLYVSSPKGWYVARSSTFPTTTLASTDIPNVAILKGTFLNDSSANWFDSGYAVKFVATVVKDIGNNKEVEGRPSLPFELKNQIGLSRAVTLTLKTKANQKLRIYRTIQYLLPNKTVGADGAPQITAGEAAPTDYIQTAGDVTADASGDAVIDVLFNDDVLESGLPRLYTSSSEQGAAAANANPPICGDAVQFKGHTVYADVLTRPIGKLQLLSLSSTTNPATDTLNAETITFGSTTFTYANRNFTTTYTPGSTAALPVEVNPSADLNNGYGYFNSELGFIAPGLGLPTDPIRVMITEYNPATNTGDALCTGKSTSAGMTLAGTDLVVTIEPGQWDHSKFSTSGGGFVYIARSDYQNRVTMIRYNSYAVTTATTVTFSGVADVMGDVIATHGTALLFWYIPGTNFINLPLYLGGGSIQASGDAAGDTTRPAYLSLLPSRIRPSLVIGRLRQPHGTPITDTVVGATTSRHLQVAAEYFGSSNRSVTQLIDDTIKNIARWVNANVTTSTELFAIPSDSEANTLLLESLNFSAINVSVSAGTQNKYEPPLATTATDLADLSESRVKSGIMISKLNAPESVPLQSALFPQIVGSPATRIIKIAATRDDLYVFKENEGIYRVSIQQGTGLFPSASLNEITQLDTTVVPVAPEAVQVLDDNVYFLSDKGFCRIIDGSVQFISEAVEQDVKTASSRTPDLNKVRSFADRGKRIYVCHLPQTSFSGEGSTFVFNSKTGRWSTFTTSFDWAVQDTIGRVTTLTSNYKIELSPTSTSQLNSSKIDSDRIRVWQYLRQERFTGREQEQVFDNSFNPVTDNEGENIYILNTTLNIVDSSFDQFDEKLTTFSTASYNSSTKEVTLIRTKASFAYQHPDRDFTEFINRLKDRQLWYRSFIDNEIKLVRVTISSVTSDATNMTIVIALPSDSMIVTPDPTSDELLVGVDSTIDFVPFHGGEPHKLKQFSEYAAHYQNRSEPNSTPTRLAFAFAVDNQGEFSDDVNFTTVIDGERTIFKTLVPLTAARGRFLKVRLKHNTPEEYFQLNGHTFSVKVTNSTRVSFR